MAVWAAGARNPVPAGGPGTNPLTPQTLILGFIRTQDIAWVLLFSAMAVVAPSHGNEEILLLAALGVFQIAEPRVEWLATSRGIIFSIFLKLGLGYLLMYTTGGLESPDYLILLLPIVTAATSLGVWGTALFTLLACATYASFMLTLDWQQFYMTAEGVRQFSMRLMFLALVGYLTHTLAEQTREAAQRYKAAAEQLSAANQSLREAEAAVRRSERLAALGQLTAGLAHELRNPLGTIRVSAEVLSQHLPDDPVAHEMAGYIREEVDRTSSLITRFLEFSRPFHLRLQPADLTEVIDRAVAQVERHSPPFEVSIYKNYSPDVAQFAFDAELVERVIYNLLLNAIEATPKGGAVTLKTRPAEDGVEVSVIDRGTGIEPRELENIFNPFFTTKPTGVGLGLAIVSKIVDEHGGKVAVESQVGKGSVFRVFLPTR
jgi:signal transduction histidine kinase